MNQNPESTFPVYEYDVPLPHRNSNTLLNSKRAYAIGQEHLGMTRVLENMPVGASCLLSNWATATVKHVQTKHGYRYTRQHQPDGSVRIWRIK
jgi:hypothetical protein